MLKNFWYPILDKKEVKPGMLTGVTRLGRKLASVRPEKWFFTGTRTN